jgi:hypothetical protein
VKVFPVGPVGNDIGVGNQHARRVGMGAKNTDRLTRLYQQRFVFPQLAQAQDRLKGGPVAAALPIPP